MRAHLNQEYKNISFHVICDLDMVGHLRRLVTWAGGILTEQKVTNEGTILHTSKKRRNTMSSITIAIPSESTDGLTGKRSDHFGHCRIFTLVDIKDNQVGEIRTVNNIDHGAGGCMKPVGMLAENGVTAMVVAGMGKGPFLKMEQYGIKVYFADLNNYPDVKTTIDGFVNNKLALFGSNQLCTGSGNCHH